MVPPCHSQRGHGVSETELSEICAATCGLHGHYRYLLTIYVKIAAMELLCPEEVRPLIEQNIVAEIIRNGGGLSGQQNMKPCGPIWPDSLQRGSGPVG